VERRLFDRRGRRFVRAGANEDAGAGGEASAGRSGPWIRLMRSEWRSKLQPRPETGVASAWVPIPNTDSSALLIASTPHRGPCAPTHQGLEQGVGTSEQFPPHTHVQLRQAAGSARMIGRGSHPPPKVVGARGEVRCPDPAREGKTSGGPRGRMAANPQDMSSISSSSRMRPVTESF